MNPSLSIGYFLTVSGCMVVDAWLAKGDEELSPEGSHGTLML